MNNRFESIKEKLVEFFSNLKEIFVQCPGQMVFVIIVAFILGGVMFGGRTTSDTATVPAVVKEQTTTTVATATVPTTSTTKNTYFDVDYEVVSYEGYKRDSKDCMGYRVVVDKWYSDAQLTYIFSQVVKGDEYYLHTVWYYSSADIAAGGDMYDIAMIEQREKYGNLELTRAPW